MKRGYIHLIKKEGSATEIQGPETQGLSDNMKLSIHICLYICSIAVILTAGFNIGYRYCDTDGKLKLTELGLSKIK